MPVHKPTSHLHCKWIVIGRDTGGSVPTNMDSGVGALLRGGALLPKAPHGLAFIQGAAITSIQDFIWGAWKSQNQLNSELKERWAWTTLEPISRKFQNQLLALTLLSKVKVKKGEYVKLCVASVLMPVTLALEPMEDKNSLSGTWCDIQVTTIYLSQVSQVPIYQLARVGREQSWVG